MRRDVGETSQTRDTEQIQSRGHRCRLVASGTSGGRRAFELPPCEGGALCWPLIDTGFELEQTFSLSIGDCQYNSRFASPQPGMENRQGHGRPTNWFRQQGFRVLG
jgi:hypothetical protein